MRHAATLFASCGELLNCHASTRESNVYVFLVAVYIFLAALYVFLVAFTYFGCRTYNFGCRTYIFGCRIYIFCCRKYIVVQYCHVWRPIGVGDGGGGVACAEAKISK